MIQYCIYPLELLEHIRDELWGAFGASLSLAYCETGDEIIYTEPSPISALPAVLVNLIEDVTEISDTKGNVDVEYLFDVHYVRAFGPEDNPRELLIPPTVALRKFFMTDRFDLPLFSMPGHKIESAFPGRCIYGKPEKLSKPDMAIEQSVFSLRVKARAEAQQV